MSSFISNIVNGQLSNEIKVSILESIVTSYEPYMRDISFTDSEKQRLAEISIYNPSTWASNNEERQRLSLKKRISETPPDVVGKAQQYYKEAVTAIDNLSPKSIKDLWAETASLPDDVDETFVRRCQALLSSKEVISKDVGSGEYHPDGGNWGGIDKLSVKKKMLGYIANLPKGVRDELDATTSSEDFAALFVRWREDELYVKGKTILFKY